MTHRFSRNLLLSLALLLLVGTQMPGAWRAGIEESLHSPWGLSSWAHLVVFASMSLLASRPLAWPWLRVLLAAFALALLTEGLQFFAIDRHPRWIDVGIDLAGAVSGVLLARAIGVRPRPPGSHS
jgi:hypothetical protein